MKFLVYDIPARIGGALTVLKELYDYACDRANIDWVFVVNPKITGFFEEKNNIRVITAVGSDQSWFGRIWYDHTKLRKLVAEEKPDAILSLANVTVPVFGVKQYVYIHHPVPFSDLKFSFLKQKKLWIYKHIIAKIIYGSMKKCDRVIVQTNWMKDAVMTRCGLHEEKFIKCPPKISNTCFLKYQDSQDARRLFFFPAGMSEFKNHVTAVRAVRELVGSGVDDFQMIFTGGSDIQEIEGETLLGLPIIMTGYMPYDNVLQKYAESVLVFPSVLETFGLPLLEARLTGSIIIASDTPFAHEILDGYNNVLYFKATDSHSLANCMQSVMNGEFSYDSTLDTFKLKGGWDDVIEQLG